jgi:hypothetical protein
VTAAAAAMEMAEKVAAPAAMAREGTGSVTVPATVAKMAAAKAASTEVPRVDAREGLDEAKAVEVREAAREAVPLVAANMAGAAAMVAVLRVGGT